MWKRLAATGVIAATAIGAVSACGDPISANRDFTALVGAVTVSSTITDIGETVHLEQQHLRGGLAPSTDWATVSTKTVVQVDCQRADFSGTVTQKQPWFCRVIINTGQQLYIASGPSKDGAFGTFRSEDRPGSADTITIAAIREVAPPPVTIVPAQPLSAGQTVDGGKAYQVRISARVR
jgi:hypothetical protein